MKVSNRTITVSNLKLEGIDNVEKEPARLVVVLERLLQFNIILHSEESQEVYGQLFRFMESTPVKSVGFRVTSQVGNTPTDVQILFKMADSKKLAVFEFGIKLINSPNTITA